MDRGDSGGQYRFRSICILWGLHRQKRDAMMGPGLEKQWARALLGWAFAILTFGILAGMLIMRCARG